MFNRLKDFARRDPVTAQKVDYSTMKHEVRRHGERSMQAIDARRDYAWTLFQNGHIGSGLSEISRAVELARSYFENSEDCFSLEISRVDMQIKGGRFAEAEQECRILLEKYRETFGDRHSHTMRIRKDHAVALAKLDRFSEAEVEMADVVEWTVSERGDEDEGAIRVRTSHAECLRMVNRWNDAEREWGYLAEVKGRLFGVDDAGTLDAKEKHANALYELGRLADAAAEYGEVATRLSTILGADNPDARRTRKWHNDILGELGIS